MARPTLAHDDYSRNRADPANLERPMSSYALMNSHGMELRILDYGGIIVSLKVLDRSGRLDDIVLGFDSLEQYVRSSPPRTSVRSSAGMATASLAGDSRSTAARTRSRRTTVPIISTAG